MGKMNKKSMAFKLAILSAAISFVSFGYKLTLGIITTSMVLIIASISTLMVFVCKLMFVKNTTKTKEEKKKAYFIMTIAATVFVALFILFSVLKVGGVDTSNQKTYSGWVGALFISALTDVVIIMEFIYRIVWHYVQDANLIRIVRYLNNYAPIAVSVFMVIVVVSMFKRSLGKKD